jgi:hypothetical protein
MMKLGREPYSKFRGDVLDREVMLMEITRYKVVLVVFRGSEEVIWERIQKREERWTEEGMGEGRPVSRELLAQFLRGFEWRDGEGEIVVDVV